jgi:hypothetical protein
MSENDLARIERVYVAHAQGRARQGVWELSRWADG